jgi:hypothetical protein
MAYRAREAARTRRVQDRMLRPEYQSRAIGSEGRRRHGQAPAASQYKCPLRAVRGYATLEEVCRSR